MGGAGTVALWVITLASNLLVPGRNFQGRVDARFFHLGIPPVSNCTDPAILKKIVFYHIPN